MSEALLFVLSERGIRVGRRYRALDDARPRWLACWFLATPGQLPEPPAGERLEILDRRVYEPIDDHGRVPGTAPAPVAVCTSFTVPDEDALHAWYLDEHIPLLHAIPGWWRTRRYRLVAGTGPALLAFHEIAGTGLFDTAGYRAALSTPSGAAVMGTVTARERRVFRYHDTIQADAGQEPPAEM